MGRASLLAVAALLLAVLPAVPADARSTYTDCRWAPGAYGDGLGVFIINIPQTAGKQQSTRNAIAFWNRKNDLFGDDRIRLDVRGARDARTDMSVDYNRSQPPNQYAIAYWNCPNGLLTASSRWYWNLGYTGNYHDYRNEGQRDSIASHEFGHLMGLDHNTVFSNNQEESGLMWGNPVRHAREHGWRGASIEDARGVDRVHP